MFEIALKEQTKGKSTDSIMRKQNDKIRKKNHTGISTQLKERIEQSTGVSLDDVQVHYHSELPAKLDALAYACGNQVEISSGQEQHLPHELGHVVQQKLGVVRANVMHPTGVALNTDHALERQADEIGAGKRVKISQKMGNNVIQRCGDDKKKTEKKFPEEIVLPIRKKNGPPPQKKQKKTRMEKRPREAAIGLLGKPPVSPRSASRAMDSARDIFRNFEERKRKSLMLLDPPKQETTRDGKAAVAPPAMEEDLPQAFPEEIVLPRRKKN